MDIEIERVKQNYPKVNYMGLADGAKDNWGYLQRHTGEEMLDFFMPASTWGMSAR
jgi:hypothetical protein